MRDFLRRLFVMMIEQGLIFITLAVLAACLMAAAYGSMLFLAAARNYLTR